MGGWVGRWVGGWVGGGVEMVRGSDGVGMGGRRGGSGGGAGAVVGGGGSMGVVARVGSTIPQVIRCVVAISSASFFCRAGACSGLLTRLDCRNRGNMPATVEGTRKAPSTV